MPQSLTAATGAPPGPEDGLALAVAGRDELRYRVVILLGDDHSGVALAARMLALLGVPIAGENEAQPGNDARSSSGGDAERPPSAIARLHGEVLGLFNRGDDSPFRDLLLPVAWWSDPRLRRLKRELAAILEPDLRLAGPVAINDPQLTRLLPLWRQLLEGLNLGAKIIMCLRNPAEISRLRHNADGSDPELAEYRWLSRMIEMFRNLPQQDLCTLEYETWFARPEENLAKLTGFLGLRWYQSEADLRLAIDDFLAQQDRPLGEGAARHPLVRSVYELARKFSDESNARERIGSLVNNFVTYQQLQRPLLRELERMTAAAATLPQLERELGHYGAAITQLRAEVDGLQVELENFRSAGAMAQLPAPGGPAAAEAALAEARDTVRALSARLSASLAERAVAEIALRHAQAEVAEARQAAESAARQVQKARAERAAADAALARAQQEAALRKAALQTVPARAETAADAQPAAAEPAAAEPIAAEPEPDQPAPSQPSPAQPRRPVPLPGPGDIAG